MSLTNAEYMTVFTVEEALAAKNQHVHSCFLAGGTDLLPQVRGRRRHCPLFIDIKRIEELSRFETLKNGDVFIGASVTIASLVQRMSGTLLGECAATLGAYALQHRATLVGNICNASPAADTAVALLCLDAMVIAQSLEQARRISIHDFFRGPGSTALHPDELVLGVQLPASAALWKGNYQRMSRRRGMDLATVGVAVAKNQDQHRIALAAVAPVPLRVHGAETFLDAQGLSEDNIQEAARIAASTATPITDNRGTKEYRTLMVQALTVRGLSALMTEVTS